MMDTRRTVTPGACERLVRCFFASLGLIRGPRSFFLRRLATAMLARHTRLIRVLWYCSIPVCRTHRFCLCVCRSQIRWRGYAPDVSAAWLSSAAVHPWATLKTLNSRARTRSVLLSHSLHLTSSSPDLQPCALTPHFLTSRLFSSVLTARMRPRSRIVRACNVSMIMSISCRCVRVAGLYSRQASGNSVAPYGRRSPSPSEVS